MAILRAFLANCLMHGETLTQYGNQLYRDATTFECGGRSFEVTQHQEVITTSPRKLSGSFRPTSTVLVRDVERDEVDAVLMMVDRICWLLSLASMSRVMRYGHDFDEKPGNRRTVFGVARYFRPTFELADGALVRTFVEQAYSGFERLEASRKLPVVVDYILQAEAEGLPLECKLVFAFVALENLKHTYGNASGIHFVNGTFREGPGRRDPAISFKAMLERMLAEVGMVAPLEPIIALRNDIVHTGISAVPHTEQRVLYDSAQELKREYLLRLLGYHGTYSMYATAGCSHGVIQ